MVHEREWTGEQERCEGGEELYLHELRGPRLIMDFFVDRCVFACQGALLPMDIA